MAVDHYENFPVASLLLPRRLRPAVELIYRFAREADDFADEGEVADSERLARLEHYGEQIRRIGRGQAPEVAWFEQLAVVIERYRLPLEAFLDLLSAFAQDVTKKRYQSFPEVLDYCRRSANPVGRLLLQLFDRATPDNRACSDSICSALQLVNFWQDIPNDYARGRVYLPQDEMARFGVSERHIAERRCDEPWRALIGFQLARARAMLRAGAPLGRALPGRIGLEIRATIQGGLRILDKIERARCDVFRRRPVLEWYDWPLLLARAL
jgi:phytoene synthase